MIRLEHLTKTFVVGGQRTTVADDITMTFPSRRTIALLGRNGAGKSTLLRMIAGTLDPTEGRIVSTGSISWPVGLAGAFHGDLTGAQNARFVARVYGVDTESLLRFVEDFTQLGAQFDQPLRTYSSGMRARLAFGVSMAVPFDTYLIDEVTSVGDASFKERSARMLESRMTSAGAIVVSHSLGMVRRLCQSGAVLENGRLYYFDDIEEAIALHQSLVPA